jgi:hypothetical protein
VTGGLPPRPGAGELGACPLCAAAVIEGREAFGCSKWREGCGYRLPKQYRGCALDRGVAAELLARGVVLRPLSIEGEPRVLCRTRKGELIDLAPPSRDAQRRRQPSRARREPRGRRAT